MDEKFLCSIGLVYIYKENDTHVGGIGVIVIFITGINFVFRQFHAMRTVSCMFLQGDNVLLPQICSLLMILHNVYRH